MPYAQMRLGGFLIRRGPMARGDFRRPSDCGRDSILHSSSGALAEAQRHILVGADQSRGWVAIATLRTAIRAVVDCQDTLLLGDGS